MCTRTKPGESFVKMDELLDPENGFVVKDTVVVACEVLIVARGSTKTS